MKNIKIYSTTIAKFLKKKLHGKQIPIKNYSAYNRPIKSTFMFYENHNLEIIKNVNKYKKEILIICENKYKKLFKTNIIVSNKPRIDFIKVIEKFFKNNDKKKFSIHQKVKIGLNCYIGEKVSIGKGTIIGNNVTIENNSIIGKNCKIDSGCVIGADGFGPIKKNKKILKMQPHYGGVRIGDNVHIGPLTNIEKGTLDYTIIQNNVAIDALVQIGHNSIVKTNSVITAGSLVGGAVVVENSSWIAPNSSIKQRVKIGKNSMIGYASNVLKSTKVNSLNYGNPSKEYYKSKKKN